MKKISANFNLSEGLDFILPKLTSFEGILAEVAACLVVFIFILTPNVAQASNPGAASLAVAWNRPSTAYVTATYTNGANTNVSCSGSTSCTIGPFYGNPSTINYVVHEFNSGYAIKDGSKSTYLSGGLAYAKISWNWSYELQIYPNSYGSCDAAVLDCRRKSYSSNSTSFAEVYSDLISARSYKVIVCLTTCAYYAPQLKSYLETTGYPAQSLAVRLGTSCNGYGRVQGDFTWNRATIRTYSDQYLDLSFDSNFSAANTSGTLVSFVTNPQRLVRDDLLPNTTYFMRVNSKISGTNLWDTSSTGTFKTPACNTPPQVVTGKALLNAPVISCSGQSPVYVNFSWKAPTISGGTYDYPMYLDYSVYNNGFAVGTYQSARLDPTSTTLGVTNFASNVTYYWRINAHVASSNPAQWVTSDLGTFLTCTIGGGGGGPSPTFRPTVATSSQWTNAYPGGFTHAQSVGEVTADEDNSYISATADGLVDTFAHNPSGLATGTPIQSVTVYARAKYITGGANNIVSPLILSAGVRKNKDMIITNSYANYAATFTVDPATNAPWTVAAADAAQIGVRKSYAGADVRVTQVWAVVSYSGGPTNTVMTCARADVNADGTVSVVDQAITSKNITSGTVTYNSRYDFNNDGIVDSKDVAILGNDYFGKKCIAITGTVAANCTTLGPGNIVDVTFNWYPANGDPGIKTQWLDYDISDHGTGGGWPASIAKNYATGVGTSGVFHGFAQGVTYYWRINTQLPDGSWVSSKTPKMFTTPACVPEPTNLVATASTTEKSSDGSACSTGSYSIAFSWGNPNKGVGWYIDVTSTNGFPSGSYSNKLIDGNTVLFSTGSNINPPIEFVPGKTYYWRIFNGVKAYYGNNVTVPLCPRSIETPGGGGASDFSKDAFRNALKSILGNQAIVIPNMSGGNGTVENFGQVLFGLAGSESGWDQTVIGYNKCGLSGERNCYGLFQQDAVYWNSAYDILNGWDQMNVAISTLKNDGCQTGNPAVDPGCAATLWQKWRADFDGGRDWNQFISEY